MATLVQQLFNVLTVAFYNRTESLMPLINSTIDEVLAEFIPASLNLFFQFIQAAGMLLVHLLGALVIFLAKIRRSRLSPDAFYRVG